MKNSFSVLIITILLLLAGQAGASFWFIVTNITPIEMAPNSEANFTVSVKGMGSERAYVELVFKNKTDGFDFSCQHMIKNVFPAGVTQYNCSVKAADVPPGNYSFAVDVAATGSPSGKKTGFINVLATDGGRAMEPEAGSMPIGPTSQGNDASQNTSQGEEHGAEEPPAQTQNTPAPGAAAAILAMLLVLRRMAG
ncbi:MAG: hypothetical protein PHN61_09605 [Methanothrix sp.]|nr:hypothetical protein [Methanothrix sp.]